MVSNTSRYKYKGSSSLGGLKNGGLTRYYLRAAKASSHSGVHINAFSKTLKNGRHLSVALETNLFSVTTLPVRLWISLTVLGGFMSMIALILSGLASTPLCETRKPRNFLDETPNVHLAGLSSILYFLRIRKVSFRSSRWLEAFLLLTSMSST